MLANAGRCPTTQTMMYQPMNHHRRPQWPWKDQNRTLRIMFVAFVVSLLIAAVVWALGEVATMQLKNTSIVPWRDLNNSHSSSSQRQAQDRSPANNSHPIV
ncbi:hypothetical protein J4Q44_G00119730 [Coregonus suidteri]|uniref:Transmembrane protein n=1 Tax=Coregonus suidteri TaxID=861788 RepID=A0AAN8LQ65_9TELE